MLVFILFFFLNDTATTEIYTLSLHDALPISCLPGCGSQRYRRRRRLATRRQCSCQRSGRRSVLRSEEHTSELQSRQYLVCRLLLEKQKSYLCKFHVTYYCTP